MFVELVRAPNLSQVHHQQYVAAVADKDSRPFSKDPSWYSKFVEFVMVLGELYEHHVSHVEVKALYMVK